MRKDRGKAAAGLLLAAGLLVMPAALRAMEIGRFEAMSDKDQSRYLVVLLEGSRKLLESQGKANIAEKLVVAFNTVDQGDTVSKGMRQFSKDLTAAEQYQQKTGKILQVEHALLLTFKELGIDVPKQEFMHLGDGFKPADPLKGK